MSKYIIQGTTMTALGDAVRALTGSTELFSPAEMVTKILESVPDNDDTNTDTGNDTATGDVTVATVDFSEWDNGSFTETLSDGSIVTYTVAFDDSGNPVSISNGVDTYSIEWGES